MIFMHSVTTRLEMLKTLQHMDVPSKHVQSGLNNIRNHGNALPTCLDLFAIVWKHKDSSPTLLEQLANHNTSYKCNPDVFGNA